MIARILAIGDELLLGRTVDSNSTFVARALCDAGFTVDAVRQVGDDEDASVAALGWAASGATLVIVSGGLGPTDDDRTRHALARAMGEPLVEDPAGWDQILASYNRLRPGFIPSEVNRRQALRPVSASFLTNDRGTAPGLLGRIGPCWVACVPGVPHEMQAMVGRLLAGIDQLIPGIVPVTVGEAWISGIGESDAQVRIPGLLTTRDPQVGITVNELGHITLRVVGTPAQVAPRLAALREALTPWLLPCAGLAPSIIQRATAAGVRLATAESCTVGHAAAMLGAVPGASAVFLGGIVAYQAEVKQRLLGVPAALLAQHGAVSAEVAKAMAQGARQATGADVAVATTGLAGPEGDGSGQPIGTVFVAVADAQGVVSRQVRSAGSRERVQKRSAANALQLLWERLSLAT